MSEECLYFRSRRISLSGISCKNPIDRIIVELLRNCAKWMERGPIFFQLIDYSMNELTWAMT